MGGDGHKKGDEDRYSMGSIDFWVIYALNIDEIAKAQTDKNTKYPTSKGM